MGHFLSVLWIKEASTFDIIFLTNFGHLLGSFDRVILIYMSLFKRSVDKGSEHLLINLPHKLWSLIGFFCQSHLDI